MPTVGSVRLCRAAFKVSTLLDGERLMSNVTYDMSLGLEHYVAALDWTFHFTVHNHPLSSDAADDLGT